MKINKDDPVRKKQLFPVVEKHEDTSGEEIPVRESMACGSASPNPGYRTIIKAVTV